MAENCDKINDAADQPKSVTIDGQTFTQRDIRELIEADRHCKANTGATKLGFGLRFARIKPPDARGGH